MDSNVKKDSVSSSKNANKDRWTDEKTKKFITMYMNLPVLWDVSNTTYNQRAKKIEAFNKLQQEFGLSLIEVRNKIRIYRTTYGQELKKMQTKPDYQPKLSWFHTLHETFSAGTIKSFIKTPKKDRESNMKIEIQYENEDDEEAPNDENMTETRYDIIEKKNNDSESTLIFTPYEEQYEPIEESQHISNDRNLQQHEVFEIHQTEITSPSPSTHDKSSSNLQQSSSISSNQLFLNSLLSTFDKLPDDKNMKARIKIQEILYKIAYDID